MRTKKFANERPEIKLQTIILQGKELDILIVLNNLNKPFYLTEDYRDKNKNVMAHHIYGRINDVNTPISESADIRSIEKMWRQHFGLHLSPLERMKQLLKKPKEWHKNIGNKDIAYCVLQPEYTIEFSEPKPFSEPYTFFYINKNAFFGKALFKFQSTVLFELEYMYCDEMRIVLPVPDTKFIQLSKTKQWFYFYDLSELRGLFLYFLTDGNMNIQSRGSYAPFIIFKDQIQKEAFVIELIEDQEQVLQIAPDFWCDQAIKEMKQEKTSVIDPVFLSQAYQFFTAYQLKRL